MQYDEHKLVEYFADAPAGVGFSDLDLNNIPHHISCIMDGNGRWATSRGLARTEGHKAGILSLREIITACVRLGVDVLSAYAFSTENWNRPQHEVNVLMHLFAKTCALFFWATFPRCPRRLATFLNAVLPSAPITPV